MTLNSTVLARLCLTGLLACSLGAAAACDDSPTSPDTPSTVTETFSNLLARGGATSRSFVVRNSGDVTMTLTALGLSDIEVGIAIGSSDPTTGACARDFTEVTSVSGAKTISRRFEPGNYCATVYDVGQLTISTSFTVTVAHP